MGFMLIVSSLAGVFALGVLADHHGGRWHWLPWLAVLGLAVAMGLLVGLADGGSHAPASQQVNGPLIAAAYVGVVCAGAAAIGYWVVRRPTLAVMLLLAGVPLAAASGYLAIFVVAAQFECPPEGYACTA